MPKQPAFPGLRHAMKKKQTRREKFLAEMDAVVPWARLLTLIAPHYPKMGPKGGRPPMPLETMLRVYFLQQWYELSDPMAEETLYDSDAMRQFAGIELGGVRLRRDGRTQDGADTSGVSAQRASSCSDRPDARLVSGRIETSAVARSRVMPHQQFQVPADLA